MLGERVKRCFASFVGLILLIAGGVGWAAEPPALTRLSGAEKERVAQLIAGAKKEGELIGYSSSFRPDTQEMMIPKFLEDYGLSASTFKVKIVSTRTGAVTTKITEELRAKVYKTDLAAGGLIEFFNDLIKRGEIMAYDSPEYKHFHPMSIDPAVGPTNPPYYVSEVFSSRGIIYNPKYIKEEILHWKDILRPQFKGKISFADVSRSFSNAESYLAIRKVVGPDYLKEMAKLDPFVLVSASDLVNKCITGEYPIVANQSHATAFRANLKGASLKLILPPEGWALVGQPTVILTHARHPNAAKLWMDFIHSEVGQRILLDNGYIVGRLGIKSKYPDYPKPIYDLKGYIKMDWRKITTKEREDVREEFRRIMIEKRK